MSPPDIGRHQVYLLSQAFECHYEFMSHRVLDAIRGTDVKIKLFPAGGINTKDDYLYVINEQKPLAKFAIFNDPTQNLTMIKRYESGSSSIRSSVKRQSKSIVGDFGCSSKSIFFFFY